jgi:hypothetical protein
LIALRAFGCCRARVVGGQLIAALSRRRNDTQQVSASPDHNQPTAN